MGFRGPAAGGARPVADAPVAELSAGAPELTKAWLLAVLEASPLEALPARIPPELARDGPALCTGLARALAADAELERLADHPACARAGALVGAEDLDGVLRAIEALRQVVWAALRAARPRAAGEEVAQLAERLALVIDVLRRAVLGAAGAARAEPEPAPAVEAEREPVVERVPEPEPEPVRVARIVPEPPESVAEPAPLRVEAHEPPDPGSALWQRALADEVGAAAHAGTSLSLLHIELADAERMAAAGPADEVAGAVGRFTQAIRSVVRRQDILARESEARLWVIARDTGRTGADALGRRAVAAVAAASPWRGAPLEAAVGVAVLGEDARDAAGLIAAAEEACFAAAAAGSGVEPPPGA